MLFDNRCSVVHCIIDRFFTRSSPFPRENDHRDFLPRAKSDQNYIGITITFQKWIKITWGLFLLFETRVYSSQIPLQDGPARFLSTSTGKRGLHIPLQDGHYCATATGLAQNCYGYDNLNGNGNAANSVKR